VALRGKDAEVDAEVAHLFREVRFRKVFGGSHDDFLEQPVDVTDWMLQIETVIQEVQNGQ
jgi:hypothetical protein